MRAEDRPRVALLRWRRLSRRRASHAAALTGAAAVVGNGRYVADRGDLEADGLQRAQGRFTTRARSHDFDLEHLHAVLHGFLAGVFGGNLGGVGRRLARALEA